MSVVQSKAHKMDLSLPETVCIARIGPFEQMPLFLGKYLRYVTPVTVLLLFTMFFNVTPVTLVISFKKNDPGGDLIRVDLIGFPGSIPGAI